ncbi:hypothetical protein DPEC_G00244720 [Dallia pectoralis]|uniref:Uncharacterized protein n=1 Tax=Dallia pectoralis TaxID=75939 RepID=A0ACC2FVN4_DALPE|nr:hypothetical protein DPEC_G00244720 [Dallia pectoralis]
MSGWLNPLFVKPKKETAQRSSSQIEPAATSAATTPSTSAEGALPSAPNSSPGLPPVLGSAIHWSQTYDVCVCHSPVDIKEAICLVSYLENPSRGLRCFLQHRDANLGGAIATEICQAVQSSHCCALLITPNFLLDDWCHYMIHQALSEGPMSKLIIPLVFNLSHAQYPHALRFYHYKDLSKNPERGYTQVYKTVLKYLEDMVEKSSAFS